MPQELQFDNRDFAVLQRVNDLAMRWSLKPYDFIAHIEIQGPLGKPAHCLVFDKGPTSDEKREAFSKMLHSLGIPIAHDDWLLKGSYANILDALDLAIAAAPPRRGYSDSIKRTPP